MKTNIDFEYIDTNGIKLHVAMAGPIDGDLVILLHGFPEFWFSWRKQIQVLAAAGYKVIAPDQRGYNKSQKPTGDQSYEIKHLRNDIIGLIDHFKREKAAIIGHDWGGAVGWHLANTCPDRVHQLVAINMPHPAVFSKVLATKPLQWLKSSYMAFFQIPKLPEKMLSKNDFQKLEQALLYSSRQNTFSEEELSIYKTAWEKPEALTSMLNWYRVIPFTVKNMTEKNANDVPVKIIWGTGDQFLSKTLAKESLEFINYGSGIWVDEATHWVHQEQAEIVNRHIIVFLHEFS